VSDGELEGRGDGLPLWSWVVLLGLLAFTVWWRGHTFGPAVRDRMDGLRAWPVLGIESEPLDCDEAAYAYMARRMNAGAVLYRDLVENKPPLGYWIYQAAVALGRADEWTIRVLPVPLAMATVLLVWWLGVRMQGPLAGCVAAAAYALLSCDPYTYGNAAQLELPMNLLQVAGLVCVVESMRRPRAWWWPVLAGLALGAAVLVRQVAVVPLVVLAGWLVTHPPGPEGPRRWTPARTMGVLGGALASGLVALGVLVAQGAGPAVWENVVEAGVALVRDTPSPERAPSGWIRWLTGNSDPRNGALPWPFGPTTYVTWWGSGAWPLWLLAAPAAVLLLRSGVRAHRLVALSLATAWLQVVLPRQYWVHYYQLLAPPTALAVGVGAGWLAGLVRWSWIDRRPGRGLVAALGLVPCLAAVAATAGIQVRDYLLVPADEVGVRCKNGAQWVQLRELGRDIGRKARIFEDPGLLVWGWQSPLYFYSGLDAPSRHFFVNDLVRFRAGGGHPLVSRWTAELMADLRARGTPIIFTGYPPFPELRAFLEQGYGLTRRPFPAPVLWVRRGRERAFEVAATMQTMGAFLPGRRMPWYYRWLPERGPVPETSRRPPRGLPRRAPEAGAQESPRIAP
jgi:4-amino-4-deoxy-L-arabinose transferase-like glycosyltransferase